MFHHFFELSSLTVPVGKTTELTVTPRYPQRKRSYLKSRGAELVLQFIDGRGILQNGNAAEFDEWDDFPYEVSPEDPDKLRFRVTPDHEGELHFRLMAVYPDHSEFMADWGIYALEEDLYPLKVFRGDMHIHTSYSVCGNRNDDPAFLVDHARKKGLDFIAVTDHMLWDGSEDAMRYAQKSGSRLAVFHGEETHLLGEKQETLFCTHAFLLHNHIVSMGAREGVVAWANDHFDRYMAEVKQHAEELPKCWSENIRFIMAGADWLIDKIHELGGIAIFAHPLWRPCGRYNLPEPVREHILRQGKFDAIEVIGLGSNPSSPYHMEDNLKALAWWQQECLRRGRMIPLVGNTDSHNTENLIGTHSTLVFAPELTCAAVQEAIRQGRSLACIRRPGEPAQLYGEYRLQCYAWFLEREYFPRHDEECLAE